MKKSRALTSAAVLLAAGVLLSGCTSSADKADTNIKKAAENFEVQRTIVGISGNDGSVLFYAEGRCSFEYPSERRVDVTCKYSDTEYRKDVFILGERDSVAITQEAPINVSEYHTRIILKPQNAIPNVDLQVGK